jgi:hypothetical protein
MENKQKEKLRKLGLTEEQVEGVVRIIENQEHFESNETNPINISIKEPKAPGSTEFMGIDMNYVQEVYDEVSLTIAFDMIDKELNDRVKSMMKEKLPYYDIKCDEENNTIETVASGHLWVRVTDPETKNYIDLVF